MKTKTRNPLRTEAQVLAQTLEAARMFGVDLERRNTGAGVNPQGKTIRFGKPGDGDLTGMLDDGRRLDVEAKKEGFDASKLRGKGKAHYDRQLERLNKTNRQGGIGIVVDDAEQFIRWILIFNQGGWVEELTYGPVVIHTEPRPRKETR